MDGLDLFLLRYRELHGSIVDDVVRGLSDAQVRGRPHPGVNPIAWLLWHAARVQDVGVNRLVADRAQVLDDAWLRRLAIARRDVGTGMTDAQVDALSGTIDLAALRAYWTAVTDRTLAVVDGLRGRPLDGPVPVERVRRAAVDEGAVDASAGWLVDFWAAGRSHAWILLQTGLLHVYGHYFDARVTRGMWGKPSP
jgi:hypothetical protein